MLIRNISAGPVQCCGRILAPNQSQDVPEDRFRRWFGAGGENQRRAREYLLIDGRRLEREAPAAPEAPIDPPAPAAPAAERAAKIRAAMLGLDRGTEGHFTAGGAGVPTVFALEAATGIEDISAAERDEMWAEIEAG